MNIFLIVFQTDSAERHSQVIGSIKSKGAWARITSTSWCVKSDSLSTTSLRDDLSRNLTNDDRLIVVDITNSYWGSYCLPSAVTDWLKE